MNSTFGLHNNVLVDPSLVAHHGRQHPKGIAYPVPAAFRAAAHALTHPEFTVGGFAALALYGLEAFVEGTDTELFADAGDMNQPAGPNAPAISRWRTPHHHLWTVKCGEAPIAIASPALAVVQALMAIRRDAVRWKVLEIPDHEAAFIRAVQLVDAARNQLGIDGVDILRASESRLNKRWITDVLLASSVFADSPKETEMRLLAAQVVAAYGLLLSEQVPVLIDGRHITRFDLAIVELKIGLMYDGAQHWNKERRDKDTAINLAVAGEDWTPLRYSDGSLPDLPETLKPVIENRLAALGRL
ncbi:hypothetical protein JKI95_06620 [Corynebacterium aquatimens]|uniref:hypothetical protein n=1 Tax=Corynebacterium aquatimens TaxID=1190508 RepID=UPI002541C66F|nr:hypothetical protein [Corynebacterium aquatimens]QYH18985.1 hypothetical protein JKI95_06620 [Corynebacterium aquatimens]